MKFVVTADKWGGNEKFTRRMSGLNLVVNGTQLAHLVFGLLLILAFCHSVYTPGNDRSGWVVGSIMGIIFGTMAIAFGCMGVMIEWLGYIEKMPHGVNQQGIRMLTLNVVVVGPWYYAMGCLISESFPYVIGGIVCICLWIVLGFGVYFYRSTLEKLKTKAPSWKQMMGEVR